MSRWALERDTLNGSESGRISRLVVMGSVPAAQLRLAATAAPEKQQHSNGSSSSGGGQRTALASAARIYIKSDGAFQSDHTARTDRNRSCVRARLVTLIMRRVCVCVCMLARGYARVLDKQYTRQLPHTHTYTFFILVRPS